MYLLARKAAERRAATLRSVLFMLGPHAKKVHLPEARESIEQRHRFGTALLLIEEAAELLEAFSRGDD